jgi:hypothetical protein
MYCRGLKPGIIIIIEIEREFIIVKNVGVFKRLPDG